MKLMRGLLIWVVIVAAGVCAFGAYVNVPTALTPEDEVMLTRLNLVRGSRPASFDAQIAQIKEVQRMVLTSSPMGDGIPEGETREPADLMSAGQGLCFDRSRTLEKAFTFLGYRARHVYVLYHEGANLFQAISNKGQGSHAVTEVETSRGWLLVDSNAQWVAVTRSGQPVRTDEVLQHLDEFLFVPVYFTWPAWRIPGLYSRHGQFYPPYVYFPDVNWRDLMLSWLD
jgi:hypothetical protein